MEIKHAKLLPIITHFHNQIDNNIRIVGTPTKLNHSFLYWKVTTIWQKSYLFSIIEPIDVVISKLNTGTAFTLN